ncbi:hypothetical protein C8J56DRAFT_1020624 [Mycena floridula]|nr:hypothetical protein C8J56DRAFT_1020624 [Mycena floridula]
MSSSHPTPSRLVKINRGIFQVAYEKPPPRRLSLPVHLEELSQLVKYSCRLLYAVFQLSTSTFLLYSGGIFWMSAAPAISLYLTTVVLDQIEMYMFERRVDLFLLQWVALIWIAASLATALGNRFLSETAQVLNSSMRVHFYPQFARASLKLDVPGMEAQMDRLPSSFGFEYHDTGAWEFVKNLTVYLQDLSTIILEVLVLAYIVSSKVKAGGVVLALFCIAVPTLKLFMPSNGVAGAGYAFWTRNLVFHRLSALHAMVFSSVYRSTLMKDGATDFLLKDYIETIEELGVLTEDSCTLQSIPVPWYWQFCQDLLMELPLAVWATISFRAPLTTIFLIKQASFALNTCLQRFQHSKSLLSILEMSKVFCETLELGGDMGEGKSEYPSVSQSSSMGMRVSFRDVHVKYGQDAPGLRGISLDIEPGQLVLIIGPNC